MKGVECARRGESVFDGVRHEKPTKGKMWGGLGRVGRHQEWLREGTVVELYCVLVTHIYIEIKGHADDDDRWELYYNL